MNLNQITVPSMDVVRSLQFYTALGLKLIVKAIPHYLRFECPEGEATFSVHLVEKMPEGEGIYVYFECTDLDQRVQTLIDKGLSFYQLPVDQQWLWREARLKDPDGNTLILYHAGENRKNPPWRWDEHKEETKDEQGVDKRGRK
ncbi:MAG: VOC family protein [Bacteroidota bacterium]